MIGYLQGKILEATPGQWIVGVGSESTGFTGYAVTVPAHADYDFAPTAKPLVELYIYTHVREDALDLFGFKTRFEKELFTTLLTVNGIGPKSALTILSSAGVDVLLSAIVNGDQAMLTRVPGIGKKTAERLVVELRDSLKKKLELGGTLYRAQSRVVGEAADAMASASSRLSGVNTEMSDARQALIGLGVKENEAQSILAQIANSCAQSAEWKAAQWIKAALSELGNATRI